MITPLRCARSWVTTNPRRSKSHGTRQRHLTSPRRNKSNVARTLAQLEKKGLIRREVNQDDKRTATVFLTQRAHELYPQIMSVIKVWDDAVTKVFSAQDKEILLALMQRLAGRAAELRDATPHALTK